MSETYDPQTEIKALREELASVQDELSSLRQDNAKLRQRMSAFEDGDASTTMTGGDVRDQAVLDALSGSEGKTVSVGDLKELYRRETDVRNDRTLRTRIEQLVSGNAFESSRVHGSWRFVGAGGDEDE